ncbi:MAG: CoA transferase, partial [Desulfobacterales bacterium]|nr:CoA transferase [Desulfobacterales bacterium]
GADVIKVEPREGDWSRVLGRTIGQESANFITYNRGKRSLCVDAKSAHGRQALLAIAAQCDVFVESFRPGAIDRLGLGYNDVKKVNPQIIYASVSGYGQTGPGADRPTVDGLIQAYSGMMVMNKTPDGQPYRNAMIVVDVATALYSYQAISTALIRKFRFGEGAHLDISLMQAAAAFQAAKIMEFVESGAVPLPLYAPAGCYKTLDGHIVVTCMRTEHFNALCSVLDRKDMISDPRWPTQAARAAHAEPINVELRREFPKHATRDILSRLIKVGVLAEAVRSYGEWLQEDHVAATGAFEWVDHPAFGRLPVVKVPGVLPHGDRLAEGLPPLIGEQSREILQEFGFSSDWIDAQMREGTVRQTVRSG